MKRAYIEARQFYNERNAPQPYYDMLDAAVAEARAEGRREAVDRILELLSLFTDDAHPSITHIRDIVLESVAGLNASEPEATKRSCFCGAPAEWPDGKCDKHHARRGLRTVSEPPDEWREMIWRHHGHDGLYGDDGELQCNHYPPVDFKRDALDLINRHLAVAGLNASEPGP